MDYFEDPEPHNPQAEGWQKLAEKYKSLVVTARIAFKQILERHSRELKPKDRPCGCGGCIIAAAALVELEKS